MLVLTRKQGEGIIIGDDVRIVVLEGGDGAVRLGIEAPKDKKIYRQEVYQRIREENQQALSWDMADLKSLSSSIPDKQRGQNGND